MTRFEQGLWDILVVGGGATGLACAWDAATRGYKTLLVERGDLGSGTSTSSTKLIHGGVRYLRQGHLALVKEALRERTWFLNAAPDLVHRLSLILPCKGRLEKAYYRMGLGLYDRFAGLDPKDRTRSVSPAEISTLAPGLPPTWKSGGLVYMDGQFDDARMLMRLAFCIASSGGSLSTYTDLTGFGRDRDGLRTVRLRDRITGETSSLRANVVINATGPFTDELRRLEVPGAQPQVAVSRGIHLVLDPSLLGGETAVILPHTEDGRVLFAIPWRGKILYGTTDTSMPGPEQDPIAGADEVAYLLQHSEQIFGRSVSAEMIHGLFAGLRPLAAAPGRQATASISRDARVEVSTQGLVSIYGGKWTTCRSMAERAVDQALAVGKLPFRPARTHELKLAGPLPEVPDRADRLTRDQVAWFVQEERAKTLDDVLTRRTGLSLLDAKAAVAIAPVCAHWMADFLDWSDHETQRQVTAYQERMRRQWEPLNR
ncbi:MAG: glycerol-3-phosphate dehydrogenase/oxidase [Verrucomicrobia bacterium]|nr:glycerol-3-phosphate dehydrogenase/oxidase [Verrucomicrobiota bacterium]